MIEPLVLPSQEFLKECFRYERITGKVFWRKRPSEHFVSARECKRWNTRYAGTEAFTGVTKWGHRRGRLDGSSYLAHRVVWKMVTGDEPPDLIDHKDRNGQNNRWRNLREATTAQNCTNKANSGVHCQRGRWRARVTHKGKRIHIGYFGSKEEAATVRARHNRSLHGEFAP